MGTWHATMTYTLAGEPDVAVLSRTLAAHHGMATVDGTTLSIDLPLRSVHIESLQTAARLAAYLARRALYAAGTVVMSEDGLNVVLEPAPGSAEPLARAEGA